MIMKLTTLGNKTTKLFSFVDMCVLHDIWNQVANSDRISDTIQRKS